MPAFAFLHQINEYLKTYEWIEADRQFFGQPNGMYDFTENNPQEAQKRLGRLKETKEKMSRTVNARAMNLLGKEEEQVRYLCNPVLL